MINPYIKVSTPQISESHWKVGDMMNDGAGGYRIGNIAVVQISDVRFGIRYYDIDGALRGDQQVELSVATPAAAGSMPGYQGAGRNGE